MRHLEKNVKYEENNSKNVSNSVSDWSLGNTDMGCTLHNSPEISVATKKRLRYGENAEATVPGGALESAFLTIGFDSSE